MNIALIGAGKWGKNHARTLHAMNEKVLIAELNEEIRLMVKKEFNFDSVDDYKKLLELNEINSVIIAAPNKMHYKITKELLMKGKNVLCEKPLSLTSKEALELTKLAESKKLVLMPGHIFRFNSALRKAKEIIESSEIGKIYFAKLTWTNIDPIYPDRDILTDLGLHPFDILHFLFGKKPEKIIGIGARHRRKDEDETEFISLKFGESIANIEITWVLPEKTRRVVIAGEKKSLFIDCAEQKLEISENNSLEKKEIQINKVNPLKEELKEFISAVKEKRKPFVSEKEATEIIEMLETAKKEINKDNKLKFE